MLRQEAGLGTRTAPAAANVNQPLHQRMSRMGGACGGCWVLPLLASPTPAWPNALTPAGRCLAIDRPADAWQPWGSIRAC